MKNIFYINIILLLFFTCKFSFAQNDSTLNNSKEIRRIVKEKLMQTLNTDEKTINSYLIVYGEYRKKINDLNKLKNALNKYIEDNSDAADISQKMDALLDTLYKITDARKDFVEQAKKILTPQQLAKAIVFQKKLRKMMQN
jgi:superfamily II RNA helicase